MAFPKKLGACADLAYDMRESRLAVEEQAEAMKKEEAKLKEHILGLLKEQGLDSGTGSRATVSLSSITVPRVTDWDAFYAFIHKKKAYELLERRPSRSAYKERLEAGVVVPGVEPQPVVNLSITKVG